MKSRASCSKSSCAAGEKPPPGGFYVEMMGFLGAGNDPMVAMTVSVAVAAPGVPEEVRENPYFRG